MERLTAKEWEPQDLLDDLQEMINEEIDCYSNGRRASLCLARDYLKDYFAIGTVEEFRTAMSKVAEYERMEREGLLVALPTPRKALVWGDDDHNSVLCPDCGEDLMGIPYGERMVLQCPACGQYLDATKAPTRADAEAALGGLTCSNE